jgi:hypothetical protein
LGKRSPSCAIDFDQFVESVLSLAVTGTRQGCPNIAALVDRLLNITALDIGEASLLGQQLHRETVL